MRNIVLVVSCIYTHGKGFLSTLLTLHEFFIQIWFSIFYDHLHDSGRRFYQGEYLKFCYRGIH